MYDYGSGAANGNSIGPEIETLYARSSELRAKVEQIEDLKRKEVHQLDETQSLARAGRAMREKKQNSEIQAVMEQIEEHQTELVDNDDRIEGIALGAMSDYAQPAEAQALVAKAKELRERQRENLSLMAKTRELAVLNKAVQDSIDSYAADRDLLAHALSGDSQKENNARVSNLTESTARSKAEVEQAARELSEAKTQFADLQKQITAKGQAKADKLAKAQHDPLREAMELELKSAGEKILEVIAKNSKVEKKVSKSSKELQKLETQLKEKKAALETKNKATQALKAEHEAEIKLGIGKAKEKEMKKMGKTKDALIADVAKMNANVAKREKTLTDLRKKIEVTLEAATKSITTLEQQKEKITKHIDEVNASSEASGLELEQLQAKLEALQEKKKASHGSLRTIATGVKGLKGDMQLIKTDCSNLDKLIPESIPEINQAIMNFVKEKFAAERKLMENYKKEMEMRRHFFNLIQEMKGNIRVYCRVRPMGHRETENAANQGIIEFPSDGEMVIKATGQQRSDHTFEYEKIFTPKSTQEQVFNEVQDLITSVLDGYNVCIFAYGQTGSGKTYTMEGPPSSPGVNRRAMKALFERAASRKPDLEFKVEITLLEIYNEDIMDLLGDGDRDKPQHLKAIQGKHGMEVQGLTKVTVSNTTQVWECLARGQKKRHTSETKMNDHSSRSHLVLSVYLNGENTITGKKIHGKLHLIDLAGSERVGRSGVSGLAMKEAQAINSSLLALGNCIQARAQKNAHVPYRDSALTRLLQDSLEKNSKTLMFVQISPAGDDIAESLCSLKFASRVRKVELGKASKNK